MYVGTIDFPSFIGLYDCLCLLIRLLVQIDMDRLADNLQRLTEDDLLHVVQLVHENKTADSYTKNDVDGTLSLRE